MITSENFDKLNIYDKHRQQLHFELAQKNLGYCVVCKSILPSEKLVRNKAKSTGIASLCKKCKKIRDYKNINRINPPKYKPRLIAKDPIHNKVCVYCKVEKSLEDFYIRNKNNKKVPYEGCKNCLNRIKINKYNTNINFKLKCSLGNRIRKILKGINKFDNTASFIGCSINFFKKYIESKWLSGMDWGNYNFYGWHIDHIIPCSKFDLTKPEEQKRCFHYTNLQPLWAKDNLSKNNKTQEEYERYKKTS
jgi:hypothetical protein